MSKLLLIISCFFVTSTIMGQSIYSYSVTTIEGNSQSLTVCQGKKLLIITLPTQQTSSGDSLLHTLDSLRAAYADSLKIIAVPSYEDGYTPAIKNSLQLWYRSILGNAIIITDGIYTHKTSGGQQHPLFKWLTDKTKNGHYDQDVTGPRNKFFVWKDGELVGVLGASTKLGSVAINELLLEQ